MLAQPRANVTLYLEAPQSGGRRHSHKTFTFWSSHPSSALRSFRVFKKFFVCRKYSFSARKVPLCTQRNLSTHLCAKHIMRAHECNNETKTLLLRSACGARSSLILKKKIILYGKKKEGQGQEEGQEGKEAPLVFRKPASCKGGRFVFVANPLNRAPG